jgi:hypothetical protein
MVHSKNRLLESNSKLLLKEINYQQFHERGHLFSREFILDHSRTLEIIVPFRSVLLHREHDFLVTFGVFTNFGQLSPTFLAESSSIGEREVSFFTQHPLDEIHVFFGEDSLAFLDRNLHCKHQREDLFVFIE